MQIESHFQEMQAFASSGARISDIESHDPRGLITEAAIQFANTDGDVAEGGAWPDEFRSSTVSERFKFAAKMFGMGRITEATSYLDGYVGRQQFHISLWHLSGSDCDRRECTFRFETDMVRAKAHAREVVGLAVASDNFHSEHDSENSTNNHRTTTL